MHLSELDLERVGPRKADWCVFDVFELTLVFEVVEIARMKIYRFRLRI